ncbi:hypothetical protein SAMN05660653_01662 [Desulfonatronum thiosulfatophilum]|uniref:Uncharacterized protein n=1 Tax=Desulfonatronum thiosulfatophilum TaxID=617002 RepID=A0A1G6CNR6_9BACT|nr:hypothetical protein [Desulfonatronum thiosulfatophilum]SDB34494.1 hypothetical protein SAMN05660653_01662 [Desulfonatronum thiosulfatophilum]
MNTREKVIVALAVLALLIGGGYHFLGNRTAHSTPGLEQEAPEITEALAVKSQIDAEIQKLGLSPYETGLLSQIATPWISDPFLVPAVGTAAEQKADAYQDQDLFTYTGYIEVGPIRVAIINGKERFVGDELEHPGYRVLQITPFQVVIGRPDGESRLELSYQGMEFFQ